MHFDAAGLRFDPNQLLAIGATAVFLVFFQFLLNNTLHGKALKAAARDADMAMLLGINVSRYIAGGVRNCGRYGGARQFSRRSADVHKRQLLGSRSASRDSPQPRSEGSERSAARYSAD